MSSSPMRSQPDHEKARSGGAFTIAVGLHVLALFMVPEFRASIGELAAATAEFVEVEAEPTPEPPPEPQAEERPVEPRVRPNVPTEQRRETPPPTNGSPPSEG